MVKQRTNTQQWSGSFPAGGKDRRPGQSWRKTVPELRKIGKVRRISRHDLGSDERHRGVDLSPEA